VDTLQRAVATSSGDPGLLALHAEVLAYPTVAGAARRRNCRPMPVPTAAAGALRAAHCRTWARLSMFTTLTTFGTPRDVTLDELCIELFYPADDGQRGVAARTP
jgi:hypothetical protein